MFNIYLAHLLRATKEARNPNLDVAFTNACAPVEILSLPPRMHGMQRRLFSHAHHA